MLQRSLLDWYDSNRRDLPWRRTSDLYAVWVSEVMLQQTQVAAVLPFYERWMARFPTVESLAMADEQEALAVWQGLGYYRRCRMLLEGARWVVEKGWPSSAREWEKVPGVGRYTAGALASICLGESSPLVDGNVARVFARLTGCELSGAALQRAAWEWAGAQLYGERPGDWNQALMELGATVCTPRTPLCGSCPVAGPCIARKTDRVEALPVSAGSIEPVALRHAVCIPNYSDAYGIRRIPEGEWWAGMWSFPMVSGEYRRRRFPFLNGSRAKRVGLVKHQVTHHKIALEVYLANCSSADAELRWCTLAELEVVPMPSAQRKALRLALGFHADGRRNA